MEPYIAAIVLMQPYIAALSSREHHQYMAGFRSHEASWPGALSLLTEQLGRRGSSPQRLRFDVYSKMNNQSNHTTITEYYVRSNASESSKNNTMIQ